MATLLETYKEALTCEYTMRKNSMRKNSKGACVECPQQRQCMTMRGSFLSFYPQARQTRLIITLPRFSPYLLLLVEGKNLYEV